MEKPGPFGPHNLHEPMTGKPWIENNPNRAYDCYFHAGLRVYDTTDPYVPKEIAYFIPPNPEELYFDLKMTNPPLGTTEDCVVDDPRIQDLIQGVEDDMPASLITLKQELKQYFGTN